DLFDFYGRTFVDLESQLDRVRRNILGYDLNCRVLMTLFSKHRLDHTLDLTDLARVVWRFLADGDLLRLQLFKDVRPGDGVGAVKIDAANQRPFLHDESDI